jgi:hypothetical protein
MFFNGDLTPTQDIISCVIGVVIGVGIVVGFVCMIFER